MPFFDFEHRPKTQKHTQFNPSHSYTPPLSPATALQLQQTIGNQAFLRRMAQQTSRVQRTIWEVDEKGEFAPLYDVENATTSLQNTGGLATGQIYDDVMGRVYPNLDTFKTSAHYRYFYVGADNGSEDAGGGNEDDEYNDEKEKEDDGSLTGMNDENDDNPSGMDDEDDDNPSGMDDEDDDALAMVVGDPQEFMAEVKKSQEAPVLTSQLVTSPNRLTRIQHQTNLKLKRKGQKTFETRSNTSGQVTITMEVIDLGEQHGTYQRPIEIEGFIDPTTTTGRLGAPNPISGFQIYMPRTNNGKQPKESIQHPRNSGRPDVERGHIMALELGGPDIPANIVPQWAKFQGSGVWRRMEVNALEKAEAAAAKGNKLKYKVVIFYKQYSGDLMPTFGAATFPTGFHVTVQEFDSNNASLSGEEVIFNQGQMQNITDDSLAMRQFEKTGELEGMGYPDWDSSSGKLIGAEDEDSGGGKKKRTPKPRQNPKKKGNPSPGSRAGRKSTAQKNSSKKKKKVIADKRGGS